MSHGIFQVPRLIKYFPIKELNNVTIFDGGMGLGEVGFNIRAFTDRFNWGLNGQPYLVGVDINKKSVDFVKEYLVPRIYNEAYNIDLDESDTFFKDRHFNMSMLNEVCEHVEREKMKRILGKLEKFSDYVFVTTPYGSELTHFYENSDEKEFEHISVWYPEDFTERGYKVQVVNTIDFGNSLFAKSYVFIRRNFGKLQRKIIAVKKC